MQPQSNSGIFSSSASSPLLDVLWRFVSAFGKMESNVSMLSTARPSSMALAREARCVRICEVLAEKVLMRGLVDIRIVDDVRLYLSIYHGTQDLWSALESNIKRECHYEFRPVFCECMLVVFGQESRTELIKAMEMTVDLFPIVKGF